MDPSAKIFLIVMLMLLGFFALLLAWLVSFDKKKNAVGDGIESVFYIGPGNLRKKKFGAKGIVYGAGLGGWFGAMVMPFMTAGYKETARFLVRYHDGRQTEMVAVIGSWLYEELIHRATEYEENGPSESIQETAETQKLRNRSRVFFILLLVYIVLMFVVAGIYDRMGAR